MVVEKDGRLVWIQGLYDRLLGTLYNWYIKYDTGTPTVTRKIYDGTEQEVGIQVIERAFDIEIEQSQMEAVVILLRKIYPESTEYKFFNDLYLVKLPKCVLKLKKRIIRISIPKDTVKFLLELFMDFKNNKLDWIPRKAVGRKVVMEEGTTKTQGLFAEEDYVNTMPEEHGKESNDD